MNSIKSNYALVTGASSGIGKEIAKQLAGLGYSIIAVSNDRKGLENLEQELTKKGDDEIVTMFVDLAEPDSADNLYNQCLERSLRVDVIVNNAGMMVSGEVIETSKSEVEKIMQLHMNTMVLLCRLFGNDMANRRFGYILNISSISSVMPYPTISLYGPTKSFVRSFTRALRTELKPKNVSVTCLIPGATNTELLKSQNLSKPTTFNFGLVKEPEEVARAGISALFRHKAECIPGLLNKLIVTLVPLIPFFLIDLIYKRKLYSN